MTNPIVASASHSASVSRSDVSNPGAAVHMVDFAKVEEPALGRGRAGPRVAAT